MATAAELIAMVQDRDGVNEALNRLDRSKRYQSRKALYRPGTLLAIELLKDEKLGRSAPEGSYGLGMVRDCNWLRHLALFMFEVMFEGLPTIEQARAVARPESLWYWDAFTDDPLIISGHWAVLGDVEPWDPSEWRELATIDRNRNEVNWLRYKPNRNPARELTPLTEELKARLGSLPEWPIVRSGGVVPSIRLTRALTDATAWAHLPLGPEREGAAARWR